jgi:hypothetical protein
MKNATTGLISVLVFSY